MNTIETKQSTKTSTEDRNVVRAKERVKKAETVLKEAEKAVAKTKTDSNKAKEKLTIAKTRLREANSKLKEAERNVILKAKNAAKKDTKIKTTKTRTRKTIIIDNTDEPDLEQTENSSMKESVLINA